ncbi:MAG: hypothetical protein QM723_08315 [Myxococcaceae bacterium]
MARIQLIDAGEATGDLAVMYGRMRERPMPKVYLPQHGGMAGIIRAHSLDAKLVGIVFGGMSASLATNDTLAWPLRELVNTATSLANQCLY